MTRIVRASVITLCALIVSSCGPRNIDYERRNGGSDSGNSDSSIITPLKPGELAIYIEQLDTQNVPDRLIFSFSAYLHDSNISAALLLTDHSNSIQINNPTLQEIGTYSCLQPSRESKLKDCEQLRLVIEKAMEQADGSITSVTKGVTIEVLRQDGCEATGSWDTQLASQVLARGARLQFNVQTKEHLLTVMQWNMTQPAFGPESFSDVITTTSVIPALKEQIGHAIFLRLPTQFQGDVRRYLTAYLAPTWPLPTNPGPTWAPFVRATYVDLRTAEQSGVTLQFNCPVTP